MKGAIIMVKEVKNGDFSVVESSAIALVDFNATWCGPCQRMAPIIEAASEDDAFAGVDFFAVDTDENPQIAQKYGIMSIPTLMIFKNGEKVAQSVGAIDEDQLEEFISAQI